MLTHGKDDPEIAKLVEERKVNCTQCGLTLRDSSCLKLHIRNVHTDDVPSYNCEQCGKGFKIVQNLRRHQFSHVDQRPFECDGCKMKFKHPSDLKRHKLKSCKILVKTLTPNEGNTEIKVGIVSSVNDPPGPQKDTALTDFDWQVLSTD